MTALLSSCEVPLGQPSVPVEPVPEADRHLQAVESPEILARQAVTAREFVVELAMEGLRDVWQKEPVRREVNGQREPWLLYAVRLQHYGRRLAAAQARRNRALERLEQARTDLFDSTAGPEEYRPYIPIAEPKSPRPHNDWLRQQAKHYLKQSIKRLVAA